MIPSDLLRQVRRLQLKARRAVQGALGGAYHSAFKGTGLAFEEVREYHPGDDVRRIDWNVTARTGHPFIKRYSEERELTILLAVDLSASLRFGIGARTKRDVAAELASLIAVAAIANGDRVGLVGFTNAIERYVPPKKGVRHSLRLLRDILAFEPAGRGTDLAAALEFLSRVRRRRAVVFLLSDFCDGGFEQAFRRAARRHDLIAVRLSDPREREWPSIGLVRLEDAEIGRQLLVDLANPHARELFAQRADLRRRAFERLAHAAGADAIDADTTGDHAAALIRFLRLRERRRRAR